MKKMKFVDRGRELEVLRRFYDTPGADLLILYGRRRVGKTRLLTHFLHNEIGPDHGFYWTATTHGSAYQLRSFSQELFDHASSTALGGYGSDFSFPDWENALRYLSDEIVSKAKKPHLIILDEFTYLVRNDPPVTSVFQKMWDHHLSDLPNLKLVLTGSLVGMMERDVISYKAPLYGRATTQYRLRPLPYAALVELFPGRTPAERVAIYSVCGGIPAYLELFTRSETFVTALRDHCLVPGSLMMTDPALILYEQLRQPHKYESVLWAIASGYHQWKDIARIASVPEGSIGHYIKVLLDLEIIERRDPVLSRPKSRHSLYYVCDDFLRFYYRFIAPKMSALEQGHQDVVAQAIYEELRGFIGTHTFERLCREWVWAASTTGELAFAPEEVGAYWKRGREEGVQLDVVAVNRSEKRLLIGEAKWGRGAVSRGILTDLIERSQRMPQVNQGWQVQYVLFAREGFTEATRSTANELGALLVTLPEMEETLVTANR